MPRDGMLPILVPLLVMLLDPLGYAIILLLILVYLQVGLLFAGLRVEVFGEVPLVGAGADHVEVYEALLGRLDFPDAVTLSIIICVFYCPEIYILIFNWRNNNVYLYVLMN